MGKLTKCIKFVILKYRPLYIKIVLGDSCMNNFTVVKTPIEGLVVVEPKVLPIPEGSFLRATIKRLFANLVLRWNLFRITI